MVFDFKAGAGTADVIELDQTAFSDFADLMQTGLRDTIVGAEIGYDDGSTLTLIGVNTAQLSIDDFRFA
jgi:hypothetical protein